MRRLTTSAILLLAGLAVTACGQGVPELMNLRNTEEGPDEFAILPTRPLEMPGDRTALPEPTPGAPNRADPNPQGDVIAALGGNAARGGAGGDILGYAARFGVAADIRPTLAAEDEEYRRRFHGRPLERLFGTTIYFEAYSRQSLDPYAELERLRRAGVRTPAAPPQP